MHTGVTHGAVEPDITESQNHKHWKRLLRSPSPSINTSPPCPPSLRPCTSLAVHPSLLPDVLCSLICSLISLPGQRTSMSSSGSLQNLADSPFRDTPINPHSWLEALFALVFGFCHLRAKGPLVTLLCSLPDTTLSFLNTKTKKNRASRCSVS